MPTTATTNAVERSTYVVTCAFTDENGTAVVPSAITWSLEDPIGNTVNSRSAVSVAVPASTVNIVLTNLDLQIFQQSNATEARRLIVNATYSSTLGTLYLSDSYQFSVENTNYQW